MVRADHRREGVSHTRDATLIGFSDKLS